MKIENIEISKLYVSDVNVRKTSDEENEIRITDLAININTNGLINPITVRFNNGKYEIIAGQRRYLAMKLLNKSYIPCNILNVGTQKAEEISLVENVQRNQMNTIDKVKSYSKLYDVYKGDIDKIISVIHISRPTIQKYLKMRDLSDDILSLLDKNDDKKISIDVAIELTKLSNDDTDKIDILNTLSELTNKQKIDAIKKFKKFGNNDINNLYDIREDIILKSNEIEFETPFPFVFDRITGQNIRIPEFMFDEIVNLIRSSGFINYC